MSGERCGVQVEEYGATVRWECKRGLADTLASRNSIIMSIIAATRVLSVWRRTHRVPRVFSRCEEGVVHAEPRDNGAAQDTAGERAVEHVSSSSGRGKGGRHRVPHISGAAASAATAEGGARRERGKVCRRRARA